MHSHLCGYSHRVAHAYQPPPLPSSLSLPSSSSPPLFSPRCLALPLKFQPGAGTGTLMSKRCWPGFSIFYSFHGVEAKHRPPLLRHHGSPPIFCYVYTAAHVRRPYCISGSWNVIKLVAGKNSMESSRTRGYRRFLSVICAAKIFPNFFLFFFLLLYKSLFFFFYSDWILVGFRFSRNFLGRDFRYRIIGFG